jgi:hypothetical protein
MTIELVTYVLWSFMFVFAVWLTTVVAKDVNYKEGYREGYQDGMGLKTTSLLNGVDNKQIGSKQ